MNARKSGSGRQAAWRVLAAGALAAACLSACGCRSAATSDARKLARINQMYAEYKKDFPNVPEVTVQEVLAARQAAEPIILIDEREPREQAVSMIPGAIRKEEFERDLDHNALAVELRGDQHRGRKIVTYCTIGYRSGVYARQLRERGLDAYNLKGSILAWAHAGQEFVDADGPTHRAHVYGEKWNLLPEGYEGVW